MTALDLVLSRLVNFRSSGNGYTARCPAHDDRQASLSISEGADGRVLLHCFAGCTVEQIISALGLTLADLFPQKDNRGGREDHASQKPSEPSNTLPPGLTLAQYAEGKKLPIKFLRSLGLSDMNCLGTPAVRIPYVDVSGTESAVRFRLALTKSADGDNRFRWKSGAKPCLYGLRRLDCAQAAGYVVLVEGESDCHTLWHHDIPALGIPGAENWREDRDSEHLDDISTIYVVIEPDRGGETVKEWLAKSRIRDRAWLVSLGKQKDPSGLYLAEPEHFRERWEMVLKAAQQWADVAQAERNEAAKEEYEPARELLHDPQLLDRVGKTMKARGYAGDVNPPKLA